MKNTKNKKNREIEDVILFINKMDNENKKIDMGYFDGWLKPMMKDIIYTKQHPEFKDLTDDLLLYSDQELLNFINSKDEDFKLNLLKYIKGISSDYFVDENRQKNELYQELYNRCKHAISAIDNKFIPDTNKVLPKIDKKFDAKWIFDIHKTTVFKCSEECFNAWLRDGNQYHEPIEFALKGRQGKPAIAQLRKFIETITGDSENTKDAYYKTVFGLEIKTAQLKTATKLNDTFKALKDKIDELKHKK